MAVGWLELTEVYAILDVGLKYHRIIVVGYTHLATSWDRLKYLPMNKTKLQKKNSFPVTSPTQKRCIYVVEIIPPGRPVNYPTLSLPWLLMFWRRKGPRCQQAAAMALIWLSPNIHSGLNTRKVKIYTDLSLNTAARLLCNSSPPIII